MGETIQRSGSTTHPTVEHSADDPAAPKLTYGIPAATEFEIRHFIDLGLPDSDFMDFALEATSKPSVQWRLPAVIGKAASTSPIANQVVHVPVYAPVNHPTDWIVDEVANQFAAPATQLASRPVVTAPAGDPSTVRAELVSATSKILGQPAQETLQAANVQAPILMSASPRLFNLVARQTMFGNLAKLYVAAPATARPRLHIVEHFRVASYFGDYGAANTVGTFTLLPGESTTITISQSTKADSARDITSNVVDSYNEQSSTEFETQLSNQRTLGFNATDQSGSTDVTNDATQMSGGANVHAGVNLGIVSFGGGVDGAIAHQTSNVDTVTANSTRQGSLNDINNAMDHHINQSSNARAVQTTTGSQQTDTLSTETSNVTVRTIQNINHSRVLNFVMRQLAQQIHTVTYIHDVSFVFENGYPEYTMVAKLDSLNQLIETVIKPDSNKRLLVISRIMHLLYNIYDVHGNNVALVEPLPTTAIAKPPGLPDLPDSPGGGLPMFKRRPSRDFLSASREGAEPIGAAVSVGGKEISVDGIVLDVTTRIMRTKNVVADALLGEGSALDSYNVELQASAVEKQHLENRELETSLNTVDGLPIEKRSEAFAEMRNPRAASPVVEIVSKG